MLELATLGLLQKEALHGYKLKQQLERFISGCISVNYGAIYPLLKRLERQDFLTLTVCQGEGSGKRKIYAITQRGRERFYEKMLEHPQESWVNARSRFLVKFVFFSHLHSQQRLELMEKRLAVCQTRLEQQQCEVKSDDPYFAVVCDRHLSLIQDEMNWLEVQLSLEK